MKNVLARATLRTESFVNTGFIYITDSKIEGIFSLDYLCISLDGKK